MHEIVIGPVINRFELGFPVYNSAPQLNWHNPVRFMLLWSSPMVVEIDHSVVWEQ
jgi:hypothetical protein